MQSVEQDSDSGVQGHASNDTGPSSSSNNSTSSSAQDNQLSQPFRYEAPHIQWEVPYPVRRFEGNIPDTIAWDIALTHRLRGRYLTVQKSTESLQGMRAYVAALYDAILQMDDVDDKKSKVKQVDATAVTWIKKRHWREDDIWLMAVNRWISSTCIWEVKQPIVEISHLVSQISGSTPTEAWPRGSTTFTNNFSGDPRLHAKAYSTITWLRSL